MDMRFSVLFGLLALACTKNEPVPDSQPVRVPDSQSVEIPASKSDRARLPACDSAGLDGRFCLDTTYR